MNKLLKHLSMLALCSAPLYSLQSAEEATADPNSEQLEPMAEIVIPDIKRLTERFNDSIYGRAWNNPNNERFKTLFSERFNAEMEKAKQRDGIDYLSILSSLERAGLQLTELDAKSPDMSLFQAHVSFTDNGAIELMQMPILNNAPMIDVEDADESFMSEDGNITLTRFGNTIVFADPDSIHVPAQPVGIESDLEINISVKRLIGAFIDLAYEQARNQPPVKKEDIKSFLSQYDQLTHKATLKTGGIFETIDFIGPEKAGVQPVDLEILKRIPDNALMAAAVGIKGRELWSDHIRVFLDLAAQANPNESADDMIQNINNALSFFGVEIGISSIFDGLDGTFFMCVTPSVPFPAVSIGIPRSKELDQLINAILVSQLNIIRPPEGGIETIPLRPGVPPLQLGFGKDYWILSSDRVLTQKWLAGQTSGWDQSESAKAALEIAEHDPFLVAGMNSKQVLNIANSLLGLAALGARGADQENIRSITALVQNIQLMAEPNYMVATQNGRDFHYDIYSLTGSGPIFMAPAAVVGGLRQQQRRRAWRKAQQRNREKAMEEESRKEPDSVDDL